VNRLTLSPRHRIKSARDFARIYQVRVRASDEYLLVYAAPGSRPFTRFGLSVSKKHGTATRRSRLKRLLREAFRLSQHDLPLGLDLILIPQRRPESPGRLEDYRASLVKLCSRLTKRVAAARP
jgi:ribonuclease P protein component